LYSSKYFWKPPCTFFAFFCDIFLKPLELLQHPLSDSLSVGLPLQKGLKITWCEVRGIWRVRKHHSAVLGESLLHKLQPVCWGIFMQKHPVFGYPHLGTLRANYLSYTSKYLLVPLLVDHKTPSL
jgi:hypothetical protein